MKNLRELREASGIRKKLFCKQLGVSMRTLTYWESGDRAMPTSRITHFARVCGVGSDEVFKAICETARIAG